MKERASERERLEAIDKQMADMQNAMKPPQIEVEFTDPRAEYARLEASGEIENLSHEKYDALAKAATALDNIGRLPEDKGIDMASLRDFQFANIERTNAYSELTQEAIQSMSYQHELNKYNRALNTEAYGERLRARLQHGKQMAENEFSKFKLTGFNANYMTEADWQSIVIDQTNQWGKELNSDVANLVVTLATAPLALVGAGQLAAWGVRGLQGLGRVSAGAYTHIGRSISAYGWRQSAANVIYRANPMMAPVHSIGNFATRTGIVRNSFSFAPTALQNTMNRGAAVLANRASMMSSQYGNMLKSGFNSNRFGVTTADFGAGLVSGTINTTFAYAMDPTKGLQDYAVDFASGFVGGVAGNMVAGRVKNAMMSGQVGLTSSLGATIYSEGIGGAVSGLVSNFTSQTYNWLDSPVGYDFNYNQMATSIGVSAMLGTTVAKFYPNVAATTQVGLNASLGSSVNANWNDFISHWFPEQSVNPLKN